MNIAINRVQRWRRIYGFLFICTILYLRCKLKLIRDRLWYDIYIIINANYIYIYIFFINAGLRLAGI